MSCNKVGLCRKEKDKHFRTGLSLFPNKQDYIESVKCNS